MRRRPAIEPAGCAAMARPVGAPPRLTDPPRPWKNAIGTPQSRPSRVSLSCAFASSQFDVRKPPSLFESEYPIMTSYTPPWARTLRRIRGTCSSSRTISGARRRSSTDSNSGTTGSVQLSVPWASANRPASLASRYAPSTSAASWVMLRTKLPIASRSSSSRSSRISRNMPSVSAASGGRLGGGQSGWSGRASSPCSQVTHSGDAGAGAGGSPGGRARHRAPSAAGVELSGQGLPELEGDPGRALGDGEPPQQLGQALAVATQARDAILIHGPARHLVGDEGIAVAVAADPRPELEERRHLEPAVGVGPLQRPIEPVHELGDDVEQVFRHEVQTPGELLGNRGLLQSQLAAEPQQLDLGAHGVH